MNDITLFCIYSFELHACVYKCACTVTNASAFYLFILFTQLKKYIFFYFILDLIVRDKNTMKKRTVQSKVDSIIRDTCPLRKVSEAKKNPVANLWSASDRGAPGVVRMRGASDPAAEG